jgi:tRNA threonylcarbamoyladenosine modification (KEOPS) complex Cgi121 subunit
LKTGTVEDGILSRRERTGSPITWSIEFKGSEGRDSLSSVGFTAAWGLSSVGSFTKATKLLPEGAVLFSPSLVAGLIHLQGVLVQAGHSWFRGTQLARNRSIDLLMRLTIRHQISEAVELSCIENTRRIAIAGLADDEQAAMSITKLFESRIVSPSQRRDSLLDMTLAKANFIRKLHSIPSRCRDSQIPSFLLESSALLALSK